MATSSVPPLGKLGAHVSAAGGIPNAIDRIRAIGGDCLQIFISSPRGWQKTTITDEQVAAFRAGVAEHDLTPVYIHALYLANIATSQAELRAKSIDALAHALTTADRIGAAGVIYHTGSKKDQDLSRAMANVVSALREILERSPGTSQLIIEGSAGQQGAVGSPFAELGQMHREVGSDRVKVCLDTCHMFQAGYDVRTTEAIDRTLAEFDREVGLAQLVVMHANDAKAELGRGLDRHENIGHGAIGKAGFQALLHHPSLRSLPWILEVPGFEGLGPDAENLEILRKLGA
ncbi:deoxyribonuclease IV [Candidatus Berkelbacteria bacterium]|nr:deoxyribonuclease IV [Candidatus Berkelbacteria bacterium]